MGKFKLHVTHIFTPPEMKPMADVKMYVIIRDEEFDTREAAWEYLFDEHGGAQYFKTILSIKVKEEV